MSPDTAWRSVLAIGAPVEEVREPIYLSPVIISHRSPHVRSMARQVYWLHLRGDMLTMIDWAGRCESAGSKLLHFSGMIFSLRRRHEAGLIGRPLLRGHGARLRPIVCTLLEAGRGGTCRWMAQMGREMPGVERASGMFASVEGVPPDNNVAERALPRVIWCKISHGMESEARTQFVEGLLAVETRCRQRDRVVLELLTQ
jgi:hypothetical protein